MKRGGPWIILLGIVALIGVWWCRPRIADWTFRRSMTQGVPRIRIGSLVARVQVIAHVPFGEGCRPDILELRRLATQKYPGKVTVLYLDFSSEAGRKLAQESGFTCAGISINGKIVFEGPVLEAHPDLLAQAEGTDHPGGPGVAAFRLAELREAIAAAVAQAYPPEEAPAVPEKAPPKESEG